MNFDIMRQFLVAQFAVTTLALGQSASAAPASDTGRTLKAFRVGEPQAVVLPGEPSDHLGKTTQMRINGPEALRFDLGYRLVAKTDVDIKAVVGGLPMYLPAGSTLIQRDVSGGRLSELLEGAVILCSDPVEHKSIKTLEAAVSLGATQLASRYSRHVQLCAVDADNDGLLERLFLAGSKQQQDLEFTNVQPVSYQHWNNYKVKGVHLFVHAISGLLRSPALVVAIGVDGDWTNPNKLWLETNGALQEHNPAIAIDRANLPQDLAFGSAKLRILAFDGQTVNVELVRDFDVQRVMWILGPKHIYFQYY